MRDELRDDVPEVSLPQRNDAIQTFLLARPHKSLGVGVGVRRALGDQRLADARVPEPMPDITAPFLIPDRRSTLAILPGTPASAIIRFRTMAP